MPAPAGFHRGDTGPTVSALQARLSELGYWTGEADGTFGWDTHHAVVAVQKAAGLERDGIVGPATRRLRRSSLGLLYRPKYFHEGVAIHGYTSVPAHPASHGCVRVTYPAMDHIWSAGLMPVGTPAWVY
jgi:hypothetical protein